MEVIHFSTHNDVGINLSVEEQSNGDLLILSTVQTSNPEKAKSPKSFILCAEERHALRRYLER